MPIYETSRRVNHSADDMFALVADVESYPVFVPLCEHLKIRSKREKGEQALLVADMTVGYKSIRETFTSQVVLKPMENVIDVSYVDGPFKYLDNRWTFEPAGEGACEVKFFIDYEFKNRVLGALMGTMFDRAFRKFADAFERRADAIYGKKST